MTWYGHRGDAVLPVPACWQQQPCVIVTPSAELSHLLAGNVQATMCCTEFRASTMTL